MMNLKKIDGARRLAVAGLASAALAAGMLAGPGAAHAATRPSRPTQPGGHVRTLSPTARGATLTKSFLAHREGAMKSDTTEGDYLFAGYLVTGLVFRTLGR